MKYLTLVSFILFILLVSFAARADAISKSVILNKVMDGSARWENQLIFYPFESAEKSTLDSWASRQKVVYPKFESDLLYYKFTYDEQFEYKFYFNYIQSQCLYEVQKRDAVRATKLCYNDMATCRQKMGDIDKEDLLKCHQKSTNCSRISEKVVAEVVDKKYCEKIYGRAL